LFNREYALCQETFDFILQALIIFPRRISQPPLTGYFAYMGYNSYGIASRHGRAEVVLSW